VPNRYPVLVCSSRSRIVDPMTSSTSASAAASAASSSASSDRQSQSTPAQRGADADLRQFPLFAKVVPNCYLVLPSFPKRTPILVFLSLSSFIFISSSPLRFFLILLFLLLAFHRPTAQQNGVTPSWG